MTDSVVGDARTVRRRPVLVTGMCLAMNIFDGYDLVVYGSAVPALLAHEGWGLTPQVVGLIGSMTLLGMFVGAIASGRLTDRIGRRYTWIGCLTLFSLAMLATAVAPTPELLGVFRFVAGLGFGGIGPAALSLVTEHAPPRRRALANAVWICGFPLGGVLAALLALAVLPEGSFRWLFAVGGLPLLTLVPLALWLLPESPDFVRSAARNRPVRPALRGRIGAAVVLFSVAMFCSQLVGFGLNTWLPQLMRGAGFALGPALTFLLLFNLGGVAGSLTAAWLADRYRPTRITPIAFVLAAAAVAMLTVSFPLAGVLVMVFVAGLTALGAQTVLFGHTAMHFDPELRGTSVGIATGVGRLGGASGPLLIGFLTGAGVGTGWQFGLLAAVTAVAAVVIATVPPTRSQPAPVSSAGDTVPA